MAEIKKAAIGLSGAALIAVALLKPFEGEYLKAYFDPPKIPSICYGHTKGVKITDIATDDQCQIYLGQDTMEADLATHRLINVKISDKTRAAFISFIFNAGEGRFASSTMLKKLNSGDIAGACNELSKWVYAGGKVLPGLVKRREAEKKLCLSGISDNL
jgi:lysozyme